MDYAALADKIASEAEARAYCTTPCDRAAVEANYRALERVADLPKCKTQWAEHLPWDLDVAYWIAADADAHWVEYYAAAESLEEGSDPQFKDDIALAVTLRTLMRSVYAVVWTADSRAVFVERPVIDTVDDLGRPHSFGGKPATMWADRKGLYAWHGIELPGRFVRHGTACAVPGDGITLADISAEKNQERRRALIAIYGEARWLRDSKAYPVDKDPDLHAELYRLGDSEYIVMVSDGVKQLDGSMPSYTLRVNRELRPMIERPDGTIEYGEPQAPTARNAVASTYGLRGEEYHLAQRT